MKTPLVCLILSCSLVAAGLSPVSSTQQDGASNDDAVHDSMEIIEDTLGRLRRAIRSTDTFPDALAAISEMEQATLDSKALSPPMAAGVPEAERAAFLRDYRRMLVEMLEAELSLEKALLDGDVDAAKAAFKHLRAFEDDGHERFMEEE